MEALVWFVVFVGVGVLALALIWRLEWCESFLRAESSCRE